MFAIFQNPYLFVILHSILTASVAFGYDKLTHPDKTDHMKLFWKTLLISISVGIVLVHFVYKKEELMTEPFMASGGANPPTSPSGI
jgi:hypothetical protein